MTRQQVYDLIDVERAHQDGLGPTRNDGRKKTVGDHLTLLREYCGRADKAYVDNPGDDVALKFVKKVAALAVRCLEEGA